MEWHRWLKWPNRLRPWLIKKQAGNDDSICFWRVTTKWHFGGVLSIKNPKMQTSFKLSGTPTRSPTAWCIIDQWWFVQSSIHIPQPYPLSNYFRFQNSSVTNSSNGPIFVKRSALCYTETVSLFRVSECTDIVWSGTDHFSSSHQKGTLFSQCLYIIIHVICKAYGNESLTIWRLHGEDSLETI